MGTQWKTHWSPAKQQFCCSTTGRGCTAIPQPAPPAGAVDPFNCADGALNWQAGWSTPKKQWCCQHGYKSCPSDAAAAGAGYGAGTEHGANPNGAPVASIKHIPFALAR